jgi:hypothetical protein
MSLILVPNCQVLELAGDVIGCTSIGVPISVHPVGGSMSLLVISRVIIIIFEPPPASLGRVALLVAYRIDDVDPWCSTAVSSSTTTPPSWRSTATATALSSAAIVTTVLAPIITTVPTITAVTAVTAITTIALARGEAAPALAIGEVGRGVEVCSSGAIEELLALLVSVQLRI